MQDNDMNKSGNFRDGRWQVVHLNFLVDFLVAAGISTGHAAELMGLTRQAVYHWLAKDDMKISQVCRLFEVCGYSIEFGLEKESAGTSAPVSVTMNLAKAEEKGRLDFLKNALSCHGISKYRLAESLHIGSATLYNWFKVDDCLISYIYRIAEIEGFRLTIRIEPKNQFSGL